MKKIVITSFLAILVSLSFYFIAIWEPESYTENNVGKDLVLDDNKNDKKETTDKASNEENIKDENKEENKEKNSDSSQSSKLENESINETLNEEDKNKELEKTETSNINNKEDKEEAIQSNASIFTVKKEDIIEKLSFKDKTKLLSVANKMSAVDVERIKESLGNKNEKEGIGEAFNVIKRRLTEEDYKQIKEILSPYINIKLLESMY